ncbi:MAG TPA: SsgA family sporulation/cell division regulator [Streptosporangiaceae bacterium]
MMNSSTTVSAELGLRLVAAEQAVVPLVASLHYSGSDPYAIRMAFHVSSEDPVEWIFARDLLADGLMTPEGDGDVQIWPSSPVLGADGQVQGPLSVLNIKLSSPFGEAHFEAPAEAVASFLDRTYRIVRMGRESAVIDIDAELNGLLWQA